MAKKYLSLERLTEYNELIKAEIAEGDDSTLASAKSYADGLASGKANASHTHDDRYYTETEVDTKISGVTSSITTHTGNSDIHVTTTNKSNWNSAYTHSTSAHAPSNAQANVIESIKVNGTAQTITSKSVNITVPTTAAEVGAATSNHNHDSVYDTKGAADTALASAKTYADSAATTAANKVKNDLLNGAGAAYDTLKELGDLIVDNQDAIEALETIASGKADATHSHAIADVSGLQSALDGKAASSHGTHVTYSTTAPVMDGTASVGTATTVARSDHKHPTDTSRASKTEFDTHVADTTKHITSTERTNWETAYTHSQAAHAPSNAQPNQNAFSNVKVGTTTIAADTTTDTLTLVAGTNVTLTPDATGDSITIAATDTKVTVDSALSSSSTNPVQNKVVNSAISTLTSTVSSNTSSISANTSAISNLQTTVNGIQEITSAEIQALFA